MVDNGDLWSGWTPKILTWGFPYMGDSLGGSTSRQTGNHQAHPHYTISSALDTPESHLGTPDPYLGLDLANWTLPGASTFFLSSTSLDTSVWTRLDRCKLDISSSIYTRVFQKNTFLRKWKVHTTHHALAWGLVWKDPKWFLISTKFRGASGHFRFDLFNIVDFHSAHSQPGHVRAEWKSTM